MELFKKQTQINFMALRRYTGSASFIVALISLVILLFQSLNFGLEFTGGNQVELRFPQSVDVENVRKVLQHSGFKDVRVQHYGSTNDILLRLASKQNTDQNCLSDDLLKVLNKGVQAEDQASVRRIEFVGSEVGERLAEQGTIAVLVSILATMIYIAFRFEYRLAVSAALALCHDAIIVLGIFSLFQIEFDLSALAAILAVMGYSLNDTIVVFDRVRENFRRIRKGTPTDIMNISINQTLSRTIMTSWLTSLVVVALLIYGGESLFAFSLALFLGIVIGTYSSIYVSGAMAISMGLSRNDLMEKMKTQVDDLP